MKKSFSFELLVVLLFLIYNAHPLSGEKSDYELLMEEAQRDDMLADRNSKGKGPGFVSSKITNEPIKRPPESGYTTVEAHNGLKSEEKPSPESSSSNTVKSRQKRAVTSRGGKVDDDEMNLVKDLLEAYNREVRPVRNKAQAVEVVFGMAYTQLLDLDEKNQVLISNVWIRMLWFNHLLVWNASDYGGIKSINLDPSKVWLPDIVLYNNAEETLGSGQMDQFKTKVILRHDGMVKWYAPTILRSRCGIDVEFFPFDDQQCQLRFLSWTYDGYRVDIQNKSTSADLSSYMASGEFELISAKVVRQETKYSCCEEPYPHVTFTIHIRRKTLFYFNNLIVPCFLITALGLLTFILPPATGERVTLVITTLLAMTVFMLMIAEKTPTTSKVTPLIGKFFIASMCIIGLSLIATCIVLNLYECSRSPDTVPKILRLVVLDYLAPFLRVDPPRERTLFNVSSKDSPVGTVIYSSSKTSSGVTVTPQQTNLNNNWNFASPQRPGDQAGGGVGGGGGGAGDPTAATGGLRQRNIAVLPREISDGIAILGERARQQDKIESLAEEWQAVAKVADRLFLIIFLVTIGATTMYIFLSRPSPPEA